MKTTSRILKAIGLSLFLAAFTPSDMHAVTTTVPVALLNDAEDIEMLRAEVMKEYDELYGMALQFKERFDDYYYYIYTETDISENYEYILKHTIEDKVYELMSQSDDEQLHTDLQAIIDAISLEIPFEDFANRIDLFYSDVWQNLEKVQSATSIEELVSLYDYSYDLRNVANDINSMFENVTSHDVFNTTNVNQYFETIWNYANELNYPIFHYGDVFMAKSIIFEVCEDEKNICVGGGIVSNEPAIMNPENSECWDSETGTLTLPNQVYGFTLISLGIDAFYKVPLNAILLNESLEDIGYNALYTPSLKRIFIPQNVKTIGHQAFDVNEMERFDVHPQNTYFHATPDHKGLVETATHTLVAASWDVEIPQDVTTIRNAVFMYAQCETKELPAGLKVIGQFAFSCSNLKTIVLPEGLQHIDYCAFGDCFELQTVHACMSQPIDIHELVFEGSYDKAILYVPTGLREIYAASPGWSNFKIILEEGEAPTTINNMTIQDSKPVRYNLSGQRVTKNYRGLVIENGRKVMMK